MPFKDGESRRPTNVVDIEVARRAVQAKMDATAIIQAKRPEEDTVGRMTIRYRWNPGKALRNLAVVAGLALTVLAAYHVTVSADQKYEVQREPAWYAGLNSSAQLMLGTAVRDAAGGNLTGAAQQTAMAAYAAQYYGNMTAARAIAQESIRYSEDAGKDSWYTAPTEASADYKNAASVAAGFGFTKEAEMDRKNAVGAIACYAESQDRLFGVDFGWLGKLPFIGSAIRKGEARKASLYLQADRLAKSYGMSGLKGICRE